MTAAAELFLYSELTVRVSGSSRQIKYQALSAGLVDELMSRPEFLHKVLDYKSECILRLFAALFLHKKFSRSVLSI